MLHKVNGQDAYKWVKRRPRNEETDIRNYALHAAMCQGIHKWTEAQWLRLEQTVQPPEDLFSKPAPGIEPQPEIVQPADQQGARTRAPRVARSVVRTRQTSPFASEEWSSSL